MKLFKRTAKEADELSSSADLTLKPVQDKTSGPSLKGLLPAALLSLLGVALGAALLWFGPLSSAHQHHLQQLNQAWGSGQAAALEKSLQQLSADTRAAARNPQLLQALQSEDAAQIRQAEQELTYWNAVVDAKISLRGQAAQDATRAAPINFAALDMLRRVENGQNAPAEAFKSGQRWLVYSAAALRAQEDGPVLGSVLLAVDLQRLIAMLPPIPVEAGQIQLVQKFANSAPQVLMQRGQAEGNPEVFATGNPNWTLNFTPGSQLISPMLSPLLLLCAALLALSGALIGIYLLYTRTHKAIAHEAEQLGQMLQALVANKGVKLPEFNLEPLREVAKTIQRLPKRSADTSKPAAAPAAVQAPAAPDVSTPIADPMFQDTDILDIDILDEDMDLLGLNQAATAAQPPKLPADIFRAYDIRGIVGKTLSADTAYWIGRAIGSQSLAQGEPCVAVGRDGRLSGPELAQQLIQGLADSGCVVSDVGMVPTPVLYYAAHILTGKSAVMLTGSHNPSDYNGFKIVIAGDTLANEQIQALRERIENQDLSSGTGSVEQVDVLDSYFQQIRNDIALAKPLRVVVDCGNGVAGVIAPKLIEALGCTVIPLYCEVDGNFPNHHPDPGKPENLEDLINKVREENADIGLAFDGDGDRLGVVTNSGKIVFPDRLLMLFAKDVVSRNPGADILFDVKCTRRLTPLISGYGGRPVMWKTGHSLMKKKMKETGALLAGEMSGHIFIKERWYGFDDGIYSAARLLEILSIDTRTADQIFSAFPDDISTPEINIQVTEQSKFSIIESLQREGVWGDGKLTDIDGIRIDYPKGWGLVRASNTTPVLVLRFEAESEEELERIKEVFRAQLRRVEPDLKLPF
ncbi:phosphomannomutase [Pseudomonas sp. TTU2014-080ASC]|nr:phosphomannomutase [Pseudomonas sp. TTU2014-080ASC]